MRTSTLTIKQAGSPVAQPWTEHDWTRDDWRGEILIDLAMDEARSDDTLARIESSTGADITAEAEEHNQAIEDAAAAKYASRILNLPKGKAWIGPSGTVYRWTKKSMER